MTEPVHEYLDEVRWQFAKTMPDWPQEYTIKSWRPDLAHEFELFCQLIVDEGVAEPWPPPPAAAIYHNHYLVIGEWKYWARPTRRRRRHGGQDRDQPRVLRPEIVRPQPYPS